MITTALYLSRAFLARFGLLLLAFVVLFEVFDILASGDEIVSRNDSNLALLQYAVLRVPEIVSQSMSFALLLGALLTLAGLAQNNEIVVLKSAGISFFQLLLLLAPLALLLGTAHFLLADQVVSRISPRVEQLREPNPEEEEGPGARIWLRDRGDIVSMERASRDGRLVEGLTLYKRDAEGNLDEVIRATTGEFAQGGWLLRSARVLQPGAAPAEMPVLAWDSGLRPGQLSSFSAHPSLLSIAQIRRFIAVPDVGARPVHVYATWLQERLSLLLKPLLMILLAAPAANITRRNAGMAGALAFGIGVGFTYFVADGLAVAMGEAGKLPAVIAAWSPGLIFAALGGFMVLQLER